MKISPLVIAQANKFAASLEEDNQGLNAAIKKAGEPVDDPNPPQSLPQEPEPR